jgi:hypothetical protein
VLQVVDLEVGRFSEAVGRRFPKIAPHEFIPLAAPRTHIPKVFALFEEAGEQQVPRCRGHDD